MKIINIHVFLYSVAAVVLMLILERAAGIGWDYHADSVTYATMSFDTVSAILDQGVVGIANSGYYFIASALGQSIPLIIAYNILLFSITNLLIAEMHWRNTSAGRRVLSWPLLLLLLNPYRIHLASTLLKDTTLIFLLVIIIQETKYAWVAWGPLFLIRVVSALYFIALMPKRYWRYLIALMALLFYYFPEALIGQLDESNATDLNFRDFDTIPTFQEFGVLGSIMRGLTWPLLAISGTFALVSPAIAFIFVSAGCVMNIIYSWKCWHRSPISLGVLVPMFVFAVLAPGFTSYIRYVYPLIVVAPLLILRGRDKLKP